MAGFRYRVDYQLPGIPRRRADIVFPKQRVAVFVDGCFWHRCPDHATFPKTNAEWWRAKLARNWERDRETDQLLIANGWRVVRVWEHESLADALEAVRHSLEEPREEPGRGVVGRPHEQRPVEQSVS